MRVIAIDALKREIEKRFCDGCRSKNYEEFKVGYCCEMVEDTMNFIDTLPTTESESDKDWISVKDRLPDDKERYLICTEGGRDEIAYYQPIGDKFSDYEPFWQGRSCRFTSVTHWQSLPEPPKGE